MPSKKFSVLISKENSPPYYIQVPNWIRGFIFYILPTLFLLVFLMVMVNINLLKFGKLLPSTNRDLIREKLENENQQLKSDLSTAETNNQELRAKILTIGGTPSEDSEAFRMNLIKLPQTFKDLTSQESLSLSRWQWDISDESYKISFQLNNERKEKSRGFLFLIQYTHNTYEIFPKPNHPEVLFQRSYLEGDSFNIGFFKPVDIEFSKPQGAKAVHYLVLAFSLDGDLIFEKTFGPYKPE